MHISRNTRHRVAVIEKCNTFMVWGGRRKVDQIIYFLILLFYTIPNTQPSFALVQ